MQNKEERGSRPKKIRIYKQALLAKLAWRVSTQTDEDWCKVIHAKYVPLEEAPYYLKSKQRASKTWQGIVWGANHLKATLKQRINNGERVGFWVDSWLNNEALIQQCIQPVQEEDILKPVREYWEEGRGWKWDLISHHLQN